MTEHSDKLTERTQELMKHTGMSRSKAWQQAFRELGPGPSTQQRLKMPTWPFALLGLSLGVFVLALVVGMFMALVLVGYGDLTGGEEVFVNWWTVVLVGSWLTVAVSLASVALKSARTEKAAAAAWGGVGIWLLFTIWAYLGLW